MHVMTRRLCLGTALLSLALGCASATPSKAAAPTTTASEVREGTVPSADGVPIHYESIGSGDTAVVLVHCWSCSMKTWDGQVKALASRYRVVRLDLAGHGSSGKQRTDWTMAAFGQDVRAVVTALGLQHVVLVGHSMGGPVILEAASLMPDRVVALVPVDTLHDVERDLPPDKKQQLFDRMHQDFAGTTRELVQKLEPPTADKALVARIADQMAAADQAVAVPAFENLFRYDERTALARIKVPIVAIDADLVPTSLEHARKYAPQFDAVIMKGVGHWLTLERPDEFNAKLLEVLGRVFLPQPSGAS